MSDLSDLFPTPRRAGELPEFRSWLRQQWSPAGLYWQLTQRMALTHPAPPGWATLTWTFDDKALVDCPLYWVSPEMCELIDMASRTLPPTTLTHELAPSPTGLVWFEQPLVGLAATDIDNHHTINVQAVLWGESRIPPGPHAAMGLSAYLVDTDGFFSPAGRTDWEWGVDSDEPITEEFADDAQRIESMAEDRRWMATFWLLIAQQGIAEVSTTRPQRQAIRRMERAEGSVDRELLTVRVVDVHAPQRASEPSGEHRAVDWQQRWIVRPHWRQQAYGPARSLRRPMLIGPYVKGPADKPLIVKDTVQVLKDGEL